MPGFTLDPTPLAPFGKNVYLRSTSDVKKESYMFAKAGIPSETISGDLQKVLQPGTVIAKITSGVNANKYGVYQTAGTVEVQTITKSGTWSGGTYTLTVMGQTTTALAYNATASAVQSAVRAAVLAADANADTTAVTVTGGPLSTTPIVITFGGNMGSNVTASTIDVTLVTGTTPGATVAETTPGAAGATDGRGTAANIVGVADTFLPWQLLYRDVEIAVTYEATVRQSWCFEYNAAGARVALSNTTRDAILALPNVALLFK